jgi:hypothetical protein
MSGDRPSILHSLYDRMGNSLCLVSKRERCEEKISVAISGWNSAI